MLPITQRCPKKKYYAYADEEFPILTHFKIARVQKFWIKTHYRVLSRERKKIGFLETEIFHTYSKCRTHFIRLCGGRTHG